MTENDLFNRDSMYWREVNFMSPNTIAEIELIEPMVINGEELSLVVCSLQPFEAGIVEYDMDNGGSFTKNEVIRWPFVLIPDLEFYNNPNNSEEERNSKVISIEHSNMQSITLKDQAGNTILIKAKI
jgi:hypothetical protein